MLKANIKEDITNNARRAQIEGCVPTPEDVAMVNERIDKELAENDEVRELVKRLGYSRGEICALLV